MSSGRRVISLFLCQPIKYFSFDRLFYCFYHQKLQFLKYLLSKIRISYYRKNIHAYVIFKIFPIIQYFGYYFFWLICILHIDSFVDISTCSLLSDIILYLFCCIGPNFVLRTEKGERLQEYIAKTCIYYHFVQFSNHGFFRSSEELSRFLVPLSCSLSLYVSVLLND